MDKFETKSHAKKPIQVRLQKLNNEPKKQPVTDAFNMCDRLSNEMATSKVNSEIKTTELLAKTLHFYGVGNSNEKSKRVYNKLLSKKEIRVTRKTTNPFTPAVKAFFGAIQKTNVSRFAAALYHASTEKVTAEAFEQFVQQKGGLVACAETGAELLSPDKAERAKKRIKDSLIKLRSTAKPLPATHFKDNLSKGLSTLLVEKSADGSILVLGYRKQTGAPDQYEPLI